MPRKKNPHSVPYTKPDFHAGNKPSPTYSTSDEMVHEKKRLRSSLDVYHRLMHDKTLDLNLHTVTIGYSDYVLGDQEMCILDWTMIEKGGDIPMHHILYFSFTLNNGNKLILWDRKTKLDRLFGSGVTKPQQKLDLMLNTKKLKNIQSQNKLQKRQQHKQSNPEMKTDTNTFQKHVKHPADDMRAVFPLYPVTDDGFVQSFDINDTGKWLKCLNHFGLVVVRVLTPQECDASVQAMFEEVYQRTLLRKKLAHKASNGLRPPSKTHRIDVSNPFTWTEDNWPNPNTKFLTDRPALSRQAFANRCSAKMHYLFSALYGDSKLNVSVDNWGIARGTKRLVFVDPETGRKMVNGNNHEQKKWRKCLTPHWDINPWEYVQWLECGHYQHIYQGAVALTEQRVEDGTHLTLPGGTKFLSKWCEMHGAENANPHRHTLSPDSGLKRYMQPIPLRKGEMVIWDYGQCHANTKNMSNRMRLSQYIRMFPAQQKYIKRDHYSAQTILKQYQRDINIERLLGKDVDERTLKLLGLQAW